MNTRERFLQVMRSRPVDRVPLLEEPVRPEVLEAWRKQGLPQEAHPAKIFPADPYEWIEPDLKPRPEPQRAPESEQEADSLRLFWNADDPGRLPEDWPDCVARCRSRGDLRMLRVSRGMLLSLGVEDWRTFSDAVIRLGCEPNAAVRLMRIQGEFAACLAERILREIEIDAAVFVEPVCDNNGPLVSPRMYEEVALKSYSPIVDVLRCRGVENMIFRTFGNARLLLPSVLRYGFNCFWADEVNAVAMDYRDLRREFGRRLKLIGGIDLDKVRAGEEATRREIQEKVPPLLADGGYLPLADGRIREDIPYRNYACYRRILWRTTEEFSVKN